MWKILLGKIFKRNLIGLNLYGRQRTILVLIVLSPVKSGTSDKIPKTENETYFGLRYYHKRRLLTTLD